MVYKTGNLFIGYYLVAGFICSALNREVIFGYSLTLCKSRDTHQSNNHFQIELAISCCFVNTACVY